MFSSKEDEASEDEAQNLPSEEEEEVVPVRRRRTTRKEMWRDLENGKRQIESEGYSPTCAEVLEFRKQLRSRPM